MAQVDTQTLLGRIGKMTAYENLRTLENNITAYGANTPEVEAAIRQQYGVIARDAVAKKTSLDLSNLSPAEERIVLAVSEYVGLQKREGKNAEYTFRQLKNRGLIGAAEEAVAKAKPTQGFTVLRDADRADLSYEQIIVDHPEEFSERAIWFARRALGLKNDMVTAPAAQDSSTQSRTEALILWLRSRRDPATGQITPYTNAEAAAAMGIADMKTYGRALGNIQSRLDFACYKLDLPPLGLTAEAPFSRAWNWGEPGWEYPIRAMQLAAQKRSWSDENMDLIAEQARMLPSGAAPLWKAQGAENPEAIKAWAEGLAGGAEAHFWVFVCNPKKWAIDEFLDRKIEVDSWGIRPSDEAKFMPGQLGLVRVGVDRRTEAQRNGRPALQPGIYAICQVISMPYPATGASDEFWSPGSERDPGWPTVGIRYLRTFRDNPLPIDRIREALPDVSRNLREGFQAASFPISEADFHAVVSLMGVPADDLPAVEDDVGLAAAIESIEDKYLDATPEVRERTSHYIERGPVGAVVKRLNGFKCQVCEALGLEPYTFKKPNGEHYVEAHHVMPVSKREQGSLHATNIMTVCANHHRQLHYGGVAVTITADNFLLEVDGRALQVARPEV